MTHSSCNSDKDNMSIIGDSTNK